MAVLRHMSDTDLKELGVPMVISRYFLFLLILYISWQQCLNVRSQIGRAFQMAVDMFFGH